MLLTCPQCGSDALVEEQAETNSQATGYSYSYQTRCLSCGYTQPIAFKGNSKLLPKRNRIPAKQLINYQF